MDAGSDGMGVIEELSSSVRAVAEVVAPSVVRIGRDGGRGCGVVVGDGLVATNAHNLRGPQVTVTFADGRSETATIAGTDVDGDLAVVAVDTADAPALVWTDSPPQVGDVVFGVTRGSSGAVRTTFGTATATEAAFRGPRGRRITGTLEHTAPLPRGSSGSPVVTADGRLAGLNTNRLGDGFYVALPADDALRSKVDGLAAGEARPPRRLGVGLAPSHVARKLRRSVGLEDRDGLLVRLVEDDSPAAAAGVLAGDLIVAIAGQPTTTVDELFAALDTIGADGSAPLTVVRGADEVALEVSFT
jgi:S1-C subfamily serine protease